jgi:hypothetical protein
VLKVLNFSGNALTPTSIQRVPAPSSRQRGTTGGEGFEGVENWE